jgi:formylglycine-generating enzyme required for sulfatase activity
MATDEPNPTGPPEGKARVIRGGGWGDYYSRFCRSAFRSQYLPHLRSKFIGFRLVVNLPEQ